MNYFFHQVLVVIAINKDGFLTNFTFTLTKKNF